MIIPIEKKSTPFLYFSMIIMIKNKVSEKTLKSMQLTVNQCDVQNINS